ncbi:MAG: DUF692 domain-containing protein [Rhodospirillales bacterium]
MDNENRPPITFGFGYRFPLHDLIYRNRTRIGTLEITVDHYIGGSRDQRARLARLQNDFPIVAHGVGLSLGTDAPLDMGYVDQLVEALQRIGATYYSEHVAWTGVPGVALATLLPVPQTEETADMLAGKVRALRSLLPVPLYLENIADYLDWADSDMQPSAFYARVCGLGGAGMLLDAENLYANERNNQVPARDFIDHLPPGSVKAMHVAGGVRNGDLFIDDHGHAVPDAVPPLVEYICRRQWPAIIILERDNRLDVQAEIAHDIHRISALVARINRKAEAQTQTQNQVLANADPS